MKKISISILIVVAMAVLAAMMNSAFTSKAASEPKLYVAPTVMAVDHFNGDPVKVFELIKETPQQVEGIKSAASKVTGANLGGVKTQNGRQSKYDINKDDPTAHFDYDVNTGAVSFSKGVSGQLKGGKNLPDKTKAAQIAQKFLEENNLAPSAKDQMELQHVGGVKRHTKKEEIDLFKTVIFTRKIEGVPVTGSGSKIIVELGNNGEVLGMDRHWREVNTSVQSQPTIKLKTQEEAEKELGKFVRGIYGNVLYKVLAVQKLYYDGEGSFIQPVYLFELEVYLRGSKGEKQTVPMVQPISMLKNAPEKVGYDLPSLQAEAEKAKTQIGVEKEPPVNAAPKANLPKRD